MKLFTVGCSFTYGEELPNPEQQCWPRLLADRLGYELVNDGRPGVGNEYIVRKTIQAVAELKPDLVAIGWTSCGRVELADEYGVYDIWPGCSSRVFEQNKLSFRQEAIKYITRYNNDEHEYRRWLRQVILLQSFLKQHNIDYIMCNVFDNQHRYHKFAKHNQGYYDLIDTDHFVGWPTDGMVEWSYPHPIAPGGHPLEQGHQAIAEKLYEACSTAR